MPTKDPAESERPLYDNASRFSPPCSPTSRTAGGLLPHYLTRGRGWLAHASTTTPAGPHLLQLAMHDVLTALTRNRHTP